MHDLTTRDHARRREAARDSLIDELRRSIAFRRERIERHTTDLCAIDPASHHADVLRWAIDEDRAALARTRDLLTRALAGRDWVPVPADTLAHAAALTRLNARTLRRRGGRPGPMRRRARRLTETTAHRLRDCASRLHRQPRARGHRSAPARSTAAGGSDDGPGQPEPGEPGSGHGRTRLSRASLDAAALLEDLARHGAATIQDLVALPRPRRWSPERLGRALDVLVADGSLTETARGRLRTGDDA